jgi:hypothetical protein
MRFERFTGVLVFTVSILAAGLARAQQPASGEKIERASLAPGVEALLDRPVFVTVRGGDTFLQRDLSDYLTLTLGPDDAVAASSESDANPNLRLLRAAFLRPHPDVATLEKYFEAASREFGVPVSLLEVIGQVESNWTQVGPSIDQGWGVMHLVQNPYCDTLAEGARLLDLPEQRLKDDARQNIRAAAALLARYAGPQRYAFAGLEEWLPALARFSGLASADLRDRQARNYLTVLNDGVAAPTVWGETVAIARVPVQLPAVDLAVSPRLETDSSDYAPALTNWASTCNYDTGSRNHSIDTWVNHWIGTGTYLGTISWFQTCPGSGPGQRGYSSGTTLYGASSAHFVIKNSNGEITQMVPIANPAYHAGASGQLYNNGRSIGVEHEATSANPAMWNSAAMLNASATMARFFKNQYGFPSTQNASPGICGHSDMPGTSTTCPGNLPWATWMSYFNNAGGGSAPANDSCATATTLTSSSSCNFTSGTVLNATASGIGKASCDGYSGTPNLFDVWYRFTAVSTSQTVTVAPATAGGDPVVSVYGSCGGTSLGCSDSGGTGGTETVNLNSLSVGSTYYVRVYDYGAAEPAGSDANFQICVTGTAAPANYTLTVTGGGSGQGTVTGNGINCSVNAGNTSGTCSASYASGTSVSLTASPGGSSSFDGWGGSCGGSAGCSVTMTSSRSVSATFNPVAATNYTLTVTGGGSGQGTVSGNGINCSINQGNTSGTCSASYPSGTSVPLTASPAGGSEFSSWSGSCAGSGGCSVTMTSNRTVSASFAAVAVPFADLTPYQPSGWSGPIVIATATGTHTDSATFTPSDALFVDWAVLNAGNAPAPSTTFFSLFVDGAFMQSWSTAADLPAGYYTWADDYFIGGLPAGTHTLKIVADSNNVVTESNESNNEYTKTFVVTGGAAPMRGDANGDGNADVYWRSYGTGANAVWTMDGTAYTGTINLPSLPNTAYRIEGVADFNADGKPDLLWRNPTTGANALWLMNGATVTSIVDLPGLPGANFHFEGAADFNGDGSPDIVVRNYTDGNNAVWLMNGTVFNSVVNLPSLPNPDYHIEAAADFSGDGKADLVWRNYTTGANALWLMNGTGYTGTVNLPALPASAYHIEGAADYDHDGHNDLLWRSYATGANALWLMAGTSYSGTVNLPTLPNVAYELSGPR